MDDRVNNELTIRQLLLHRELVRFTTITFESVPASISAATPVAVVSRNITKISTAGLPSLFVTIAPGFRTTGST